MNAMSADEPQDPIESIAPLPPLGQYTRLPPHVREAGVPRRFGMGTLLLITAMYAVLFAVLRALGLPPSAFLFVALFFTAVGLGQMLLFKGEHPRRASIVVGMAFHLANGLLRFGYEAVRFGTHALPDPCSAFVTVIVGGGIAGYLCGLLIAAIFLLIDKWKSHRADLRLRENKD